LIGGTENDRLRGGAGNDVIDADDDSGGDVVRGGPGFDTCYVDLNDIRRGCERVIT
jgi:Ca2+-binding RTX toxin-like protein